MADDDLLDMLAAQEAADLAAQAAPDAPPAGGGEPPGDRTPAQKFLDFHEANPHVYRVLEDACQRFVDSYGVRRTSIDYLVHFARYERIVGTRMSGIDGDYKIANQHTAFYARLLLNRHPQWGGLFETRRSAADDDPGWLQFAA